VDNEATLKRVYYYPEAEKLILTAENPAFPPMVFVGEELADIRILGRAVAFQSKVR
jgi:repressor LexA